jgi:hypothetical protein
VGHKLKSGLPAAGDAVPTDDRRPLRLRDRYKLSTRFSTRELLALLGDHVVEDQADRTDESDRKAGNDGKHGIVFLRATLEGPSAPLATTSRR